MSDEINILIGSEGPNLSTGYARVIDNLFSGWKDAKVYVMSWQYHGQPMPIGSKKRKKEGKMAHVPNFVLLDPGLANMHSEEFPNNIEKYMNELNPDLFFSLIDIWYTKKMSAVCKMEEVPYVNYFPVDSKPVPMNWLSLINNSTHPVCMSKFGVNATQESVKKYLEEKEWEKFEDLKYIHHGVDTDVFYYDKQKKEKDRGILKAMLEENDVHLKEEPYFVHFGNRNVTRKNLPCALEAFSHFIKDKPNVYGVAKWGMWRDTNNGNDLSELVSKFGLQDRIIKLDNEENPLSGLPEEFIAGSLSACDVYVSATMGEGFGLWTLQAEATATPPIISNNTTAPELIGENEERGLLVDCPTWIRSEHNTKFQICDVRQLRDKMEWAYDNQEKMREKGLKGWEFAQKKDWSNIQNEFRQFMMNILED